MGKFRYPVGDGTRADFEKNWYVATGFGIKRQGDNYIHEGADINLKTGGDSDLGQPLYAVADWRMKYYHLKSHLEAGFGEHFVYEVESPRGKRWIHYAHCQNTIDPNKKSSGKVGDKLAEIDKTGRPRQLLPAHVHLTVFKVDPSSLPKGIDTITNDKAQLNEWFDDPIAFFAEWDSKQETGDTMPELRQLIIDIRLGLLGKAPSEDKIIYDIGHWENPKAFVERITGDAKFFEKYVKPQLESQKIVSESACNTAKEALNTDWQSVLATAKKEKDEEIRLIKEDRDNKLKAQKEDYEIKLTNQKESYQQKLDKKFSDLDFWEKLRLLFKKGGEA